MKKYSTPEDLNAIEIKIPLNRARNLLTLCQNGAADATHVLAKAKEFGVKLGTLQRATLELYVNNCKFFRDIITSTIEENVSHADQDIIKLQEYELREKLTAELVKGYSKRIREAHDCPNDDCDTCKNIRVEFESQDIKDEFDLDSLPEGSIIVPGSKEEN